VDDRSLVTAYGCSLVLQAEEEGRNSLSNRFFASPLRPAALLH
jgi:hypothetical protein